MLGLPKLLVSFRTVLKNITLKNKLLCLLFGNFLKKIGLLFSSTSGHTESDIEKLQRLAGSSSRGRKQFFMHSTLPFEK